jgi:hypothetical protein
MLDAAGKDDVTVQLYVTAPVLSEKYFPTPDVTGVAKLMPLTELDPAVFRFNVR